MRYTLELSEEQAEMVKIALEEYFRLRMNQTWDFADDICFEGFDYENHAPEDFSKRLEQRDMFRSELEKLLNTAHPLQFSGYDFRPKTAEMLIAQDIWQVIRHQLWADRIGKDGDWCVDSRKPMRLSVEPIPKIKRLDDDES